MPNPKATLRNYQQVLKRLIDFAAEDKHNAKIIVAAINTMLDELLQADFFGTEGQCDPRGDHRE